MASELDPLVTQFAAGHGLGAPAPDDDGAYHFVIDDLELALFQHGDQILLEGRLGKVAGNRGEARQMLQQCLRRQLGRLRDHPEVLTLDDETDELLLFLRLPARETRAADLDSAVGAFANSLEFWHQSASCPTRRDAPLRKQVFRP